MKLVLSVLAILCSGTPEIPQKLGIDEVRSTLLERTTEPAEDADALLNKGVAFVTLERLAEPAEKATFRDAALTAFSGVLAKEGDEFNALVFSAYAYLADSAFEQAIEAGQRIVSAGPNLPQNYDLLEEIYLSAGRASDYAAYLDEAVKRAPSHANLLSLAGPAYRAKDWVRVRDIATQALSVVAAHSCLYADWLRRRIEANTELGDATAVASDRQIEAAGITDDACLAPACDPYAISVLTYPNSLEFAAREQGMLPPHFVLHKRDRQL